MTTKVFCDRCGGEKDVKRTKLTFFGRTIDVYDATALDKDLCITCRKALSTIVGKFINKDDITFVR